MRVHPAYANIASTLALVVALGTGGAYAASIAKDSVKSKHIKDGNVKTVDIDEGAVTEDELGNGSVTTDQLANASVTAAKLAPGAVANASIPDGSVTTAKLANGAVTGSKLQGSSVTGAAVAANTLTGAEINETSLSVVPDAAFAVRAQNTAAAVVDSNGTLKTGQSYQAASAVRVAAGQYEVTFTRTITACAYVGGAGYSNNTVASNGTSATAYYKNSTTLSVFTFNGTNVLDNPFQVLVIC